MFYHVRWESRGWIRGVWQWSGEACTGRSGESSWPGIWAEGWARRRPRQVFVPRGGQSRGPVSRTWIQSQRARGLVEVTLRIGHWWARVRSPNPKRGRKKRTRRQTTAAKIINNQLNNQPCKQSLESENKKKASLHCPLTGKNPPKDLLKCPHRGNVACVLIP